MLTINEPYEATIETEDGCFAVNTIDNLIELHLDDRGDIMTLWVSPNEFKALAQWFLEHYNG